MTQESVLEFAKNNQVQMVDIKFCDMLGTWQHFTIPIAELTDQVFEDGLFFDGSSIRGWRSIHESDMLVIPDAITAKLDPFMDIPTLSLIADVYDPNTKQPYSRDPRQVVKRAVAHLKSTGIADTAYFGPEAEFFIFDDVRYDQNAHHAFFMIDSNEAIWNSGREEGGNLGYKPRHKEGYFPALPYDEHHQIRTEICLELAKLGISVERHHHEVATAGQGEINFRYDSILEVADKLMWFKYVVKNVARRHGKTATFMPKPIFGDNGSGMHCHMSLWKAGQPLFAGDRYAGLSELALHFIGGILKNAPATCGLHNPTTNSYKRLVPGFEAPVKLAYSYHNRSAAIRIPNTGSSPKAKRIEFRTPDASSNIYLTLAALLMAGLDGIKNKVNPGAALDKDIYSLPPDELSQIRSVPATLDEALQNLRSNHGFLLQGGVFSQDLIDAWLGYKYEKELIPMQQRPTPYEFHLYFDV